MSWEAWLRRLLANCHNDILQMYLRDGGDRIDVSDASRLDTNEREDKSEDKRENGLPDIHVELCGKNCAAHDCTQEKPNRPPGKRNTVGDRGLGNDSQSFGQRSFCDVSAPRPHHQDPLLFGRGTTNGGSF